MMLQCYGYSDDTAIIEGYVEEGQNRGQKILTRDCGCFNRPAYAEITSGNEGIILAFNYVGTWAIGIAQLDEGIPIPEWAEHPYTQMIDEGEYSVCLELYGVPDNIKVQWFKMKNGYREEVEE